MKLTGTLEPGELVTVVVQGRSMVVKLLAAVNVEMTDVAPPLDVARPATLPPQPKRSKKAAATATTPLPLDASQEQS